MICFKSLLLCRHAEEIPGPKTTGSAETGSGPTARIDSPSVSGLSSSACTTGKTTNDDPFSTSKHHNVSKLLEVPVHQKKIAQDIEEMKGFHEVFDAMLFSLETRVTNLESLSSDSNRHDGSQDRAVSDISSLDKKVNLLISKNEHLENRLR